MHAIEIMVLSNTIKSVSLLARALENPPCNSATRKTDRIKIVIVARARPDKCNVISIRTIEPDRGQHTVKEHLPFRAHAKASKVIIL